MFFPGCTKFKIGRLAFLILICTLSFYACKSSGAVQSSAPGREYEVVDHSQQARQDSLLLERFAQRLNTESRVIRPSLSLYKFIDQKLNIPCSDQPGGGTTNDVKFARQLFETVYNRKIPGSYDELYTTNLVAKFSATSYLAEGDLLFFEENAEEHRNEKLRNDPLENVVGVYLRNSRFVTCSDEDGAVAVNNLDRPYWKSRYKVAGRLR